MNSFYWTSVILVHLCAYVCVYQWLGVLIQYRWDSVTLAPCPPIWTKNVWGIQNYTPTGTETRTLMMRELVHNWVWDEIHIFDGSGDLRWVWTESKRNNRACGTIRLEVWQRGLRLEGTKSSFRVNEGWAVCIFSAIQVSEHPGKEESMVLQVPQVYIWTCCVKLGHETQDTAATEACRLKALRYCSSVGWNFRHQG